MSLEQLMVRPVTISTPSSTTDSYGNTVAVWPGTSRSTTGWLDPNEAEEFKDDRTGTRTVSVLYLRAGETIGPHDRVTIDSVVYEVDGEPARRWTPAGEHHVEARIEAVEG